MATHNNTFWQRYKYKLNGLVIVLPFYFLYHALTPKFPDAWQTKLVGEFEVTLSPSDLEAPYLHDGVFTKDLNFSFTQGNVNNIRQAYVNIGKDALPLTKLALGNDGILHGSQHGQEAHAISPEELSENDKVWLTIENWQGGITVASWDLPAVLTQ